MLRPSIAKKMSKIKRNKRGERISFPLLLSWQSVGRVLLTGCQPDHSFRTFRVLELPSGERKIGPMAKPLPLCFTVLAPDQNSSSTGHSIAPSGSRMPASCCLRPFGPRVLLAAFLAIWERGEEAFYLVLTPKSVNRDPASLVAGNEG